MATMKCIVFVVIVLSVYLIEGGAGGSKARIENEKARGRRARKILASAEEVIEAVSKLTNDSSSSEGKPVKDLLAEAKNVHNKLRKSMKSIGKFLKQRPMVGMLKVIKTLSETVGNASSTNAVLDLLIGWSGPLSREGSCVSMTTSMLSDLEGKSVLVVKQLKTEGGKRLSM
ncbi:uncharacterized protein LOC106150860 [Lingula anatina]|uniref:Uncharacterized protein LOC106150860 n=1 Tax=Lingula anatina TaxID=7574 RepID=A0A1S3H2G0_LINAN|nr:uncharacterized protein LOC106150860 [Lingula anatina]|eukprot:XP_013379329.1 uncharacterized protein LOC106150860 [Lingula anatina]